MSKLVVAGALTACMFANATLTMFPSVALSAFAGNEWWEYDTFDDGVGLPWSICESGPAKMRFDISEGSFNVQIVNQGGAAQGGESRRDCQFRCRGLKIQPGHTYRVMAEVTADQDGEIYTMIGESDGPFTEYWHNGYGGADIGLDWSCMPVKAGETLKIDSKFTPTADQFAFSASGAVCEWSWQFGGAGPDQLKDCFPVGTNLKFDNLYLIDETMEESLITKPNLAIKKQDIRVNQVGYYSKLAKKASLIVAKDTAADQTFTLQDAAGKTVYTGYSREFGFDQASDDYVQILDFSDYRQPGTYTLHCGESESYPFEISDTLYDGVLTNAVNYFYQNRSGVEIKEDYITSKGKNDSKSALTHKAGHNPDQAFLQEKWQKNYAADGSDIDQDAEADVTGGWYDGNDHSKYVPDGAVSVWMLQNMYERALSGENHSDVKKFADGSGTVVVPEAGNDYPDLLDEARVELEWMFKMLAPADYTMEYNAVYDGGKTTGKYENMVFYNVKDSKWTGVAILPDEYAEAWGTERIVSPPSTSATLDVAAVAAQAARLWQTYDADFAATCLDVAEKCYAAALANPELMAPLNVISDSDKYADFTTSDDFYLAACELFATTGKEAYMTRLSEYTNAFQVCNQHDAGTRSYISFSYQQNNVENFGTMSLYLNQKNLTESQIETMKKSICAVADAKIEEENTQGNGTPYRGVLYSNLVDTNDYEGYQAYEWASNSFVINDAIIMAYAYDVSGKNEYINGVSSALDYLFGRNAMDFSYVSGYGDRALSNPYHRFWANQMDSSFPSVPDGVLCAGPNSELQDPYARLAGLKLGETAAQKCYIDNAESWSTNEVSMLWNAPFAWVMSFMEDEAPNVKEIIVDPVDYGDMNCDGKVSITDLVMMARYAAEDDEMIPPTAQGIKNADCYCDGKVNSSDITTLARFLAHLIPEAKIIPE